NNTIVHRLKNRVVPDQGGALGPAAPAGWGERCRPREAQLAHIRLIDLLELAVTLFVLVEAIGKPGARQRVLCGAGRLQNPRIHGTRLLLGDDGGDERESGKAAESP